MLCRALFATLIAVAAVTASPLPQADNCEPVAPKDQEFGVAFSVGNDAAGQLIYVSANLVQNGTDGNFVLEAERLSVYPGTPAYLNGTSPTASLVFDLDGKLYGAEAADLGEVYGAHVPISVSPTFQEKQWGVGSDGGIYHQLKAASNGFFACNSTINGQPNYVLSWGVSEGTTAPDTCMFTNVIQNFNVPGGLTGPAS